MARSFAVSAIGILIVAVVVLAPALWPREPAKLPAAQAQSAGDPVAVPLSGALGGAVLSACLALGFLAGQNASTKNSAKKARGH